MVSPGGYRKRATPVPIPNTEVKPLIADGTAWVTVWESRELPEFIRETPLTKVRGVFCCQKLHNGLATVKIERSGSDFPSNEVRLQAYI